MIGAAWKGVGLGDGCRDAGPTEAYDSPVQARLDPVSGQGSIPCAAAVLTGSSTQEQP